jgi:hypothetical protein
MHSAAKSPSGTASSCRCSHQHAARENRGRTEARRLMRRIPLRREKELARPGLFEKRQGVAGDEENDRQHGQCRHRGDAAQDPRPASSASLRRSRAPGESSMEDVRFIYFSGTGT